MHRNKTGFTLAFIVLTLTSSLRAVGQWVQTSGPNTNTVTCVAVNGADLFAGTSGDGVFRSSDDGANWSVASIGLPKNTIACCLAVSGAYLFVGTLQDGVFRSSDNGASWSPTGLTGMGVNSLAVSGAYLFAGIGGTAGVFRSNDNGASWKASNSVFNFAVINAIVVSGAYLVAGTLVGGVFRSSDNGVNWTSSNMGLSNYEVYALAACGTNLFAAINGGVFRSDDNGAKWVSANAGLPGPNIHSFAVFGSNLFAGTHGLGTRGGVYLSTDNGVNWTTANTAWPEYSYVFALAVGSAHLFAGADNKKGVWRRPLSEMITGVEEPINPAGSAAVVYPNPFQDKATIHFTTTERGNSDVRVVNVLGATVAILFEGALEAGEHAFSWEASNAPRGTYYAIMRGAGQVRRVALTLLR